MNTIEKLKYEIDKGVIDIKIIEQQAIEYISRSRNKRDYIDEDTDYIIDHQCDIDIILNDKIICRELAKLEKQQDDDDIEEDIRHNIEERIKLLIPKFWVEFYHEFELGNDIPCDNDNCYYSNCQYNRIEEYSHSHALTWNNEVYMTYCDECFDEVDENDIYNIVSEITNDIL
jgi:hypothetical protein